MAVWARAQPFTNPLLLLRCSLVAWGRHGSNAHQEICMIRSRHDCHASILFWTCQTLWTFARWASWHQLQTGCLNLQFSSANSNCEMPRLCKGCQQACISADNTCTWGAHPREFSLFLQLLMVSRATFQREQQPENDLENQ